jgi:hypothetical protein
VLASLAQFGYTIVHDAHHAFPPRQTVDADDSVMSQHDPEKRHRRNDMPGVLSAGLQDDDAPSVAAVSGPALDRQNTVP